MKQYVSFISKEFMHILRDRRSMFILLAVPVVLLLLFGYAVSTEVKNVRVAVLDMSHDELTRKACDRLAANPYMSLETSLRARRATAWRPTRTCRSTTA